MKTYRNEQFGFEIDIPEQWSLDTGSQSNLALGKSHSFIFRCRLCEAFNFQVKPLNLDSDPSQAESELRQFIQEKGYTSHYLGKFTAAGKEHVWARYYLGYGNWSKKYILTLNNLEYTFTAACLEQKYLLEMEKAWDEVASSFRLLKPADEAIRPKSESSEPKDGIAAEQSIERGKMMSQIPAQNKLAGMKTYWNEKHVFEIDIPEAWSPAPAPPPGLMNALTMQLPPGISKDCFQYGCADEALNFEITPLSPEPLLEDTETEFKLFARDSHFTDLHFGRIEVAGKQHVCAYYFINDWLGQRWNKKYMLVFGGIEYALTATCNDPGWFAKREKEWDAIIQTFHVLVPVDDSANATSKAERERQQRREVIQERIQLRELTGELYARAYEAVAMGQYEGARALLEECLRENPDHILAHKELAVVLQKLGDNPGAIKQRREVERLAPEDSVNRAKLAKLVAESGSPGSLLKKVVTAPISDGLHPKSESSLRGSSNLHGVDDESKLDYTLAFSSRAYLFIQTIAFVYIYFRVTFKTLLTLTSEAHQPLSTFEYYALGVILFFGIGATVCELFLLGVAFNEEFKNINILAFDFIRRTMLVGDEHKQTLGDKSFSDYTRLASGNRDAIGLQLTTLFHALNKIIVIPFHIAQLNIGTMLVFAFLPLASQFLLKQRLPDIWGVVYLFALFFFCYRAFLLQTAQRKGVGKTGHLIGNRQILSNPSLEALIQSASPGRVTPELITKVLNQENILRVIQNDLAKTRQIGYMEMWRLGLITPDQDMFEPHPEQPSRQETMKRMLKDYNYLLNLQEQIPLNKTAILNNIGTFNIQHNGLVVTWGAKETALRRRPVRVYHLKTKLNRNEFIDIRNIQMEDRLSLTENRSQLLPKFLQEEGFPLKQTYTEGDPLNAERGGVIVIDKGKILVTYPRYFVQRSLIDDEGNLVNLGLDENFSPVTMFEVKMRPSVLGLLIKSVDSKGYIPLLRYRSCPYPSEFILPILDTPLSANGWADLFIDPTGRARLFIAKEKTEAEWVEMMGKLRQLFYAELARKNYHFLAFTKDKTHLSNYLHKKQQILKDYYIFQEWKLF